MLFPRYAWRRDEEVPMKTLEIVLEEEDNFVVLA
jgi:hypothetical protein